MVKLFIHPAVSICLVASVMALAAQPAAAPQPDDGTPKPAEVCTHPWKYSAEPFRIAGNLYYVGNKNVSSHLIDTGKGLILLDTAFPQTGYLLLESIRRLGFDPKDIAYIVHTHAHYDHMGATRAMVELTGAKTVLGKADAEMMRDRPELTWAPEYGMPFYESFGVDVQLADGDTVALGSTTITCVHTPGHTPGCFSYFFNVTEKGRTWRVGIFGGPGLNTLTQKYRAQYGLSLSAREDYLKSVERLKKEPVDIFIGAHPDQSAHFQKKAGMTEAKNPFIDSEAWPAFLTRLAEAARSAFGTK